jgi:uncharacterized protein YfiM (DUF2279 family)
MKAWFLGCGLFCTVLFAAPVQASLKQSLFTTLPDTSLPQVQLTYNPRVNWTNDRWFAEDKANHFLVSMMLSSTIYLGLVANDNNHGQSLLGAITGTLIIGAGKEIWDKFHPGTPSWRDLTADAVGAIFGGLVARTLP